MIGPEWAIRVAPDLITDTSPAVRDLHRCSTSASGVGPGRSRRLVSMVSPAPKRPYQGRRVNALQALALLLAFALVSGLGGVLAAGLVMPAVATASLATDTSVGLFEELPTELEEVALPERSVILAADGTKLADFYEQNRIVVTLDRISPHMRNAVVATEDRRFYDHSGVDLAGLTRAVIRNVTTEDTEGGSTLTQQYIKNLLIQSALTGDLTAEERADAIDAAREAEGVEGYARKLEEAKLAIALEDRLTKEQILEGYLNIAQFGQSQIYGVEAAAQYYFSIPSSDLNYLQAATIAGVTQLPGRWDPTVNPEASQARRNVVLHDMLREQYITREEYEAGIATPLVDTLAVSTPQFTCAAANAVANAGYFCDYVTKVIRNHPAFGATPEERYRLLYEGGLTIKTTLDPRLQAIADEEVKNGIPVLDPSGVASAITVIEPGTGYIKAMAQNRVYNPSEGAAPGETAVNYNTDAAHGGAAGFPPGSTFKPFTLMQWLREGRSLNENIDGRRRERVLTEFNASCTGFAPTTWNPRNSEGPPGGAFMTVQDATRNSVNSGYVEMAAQLDLCAIFDGATQLGIRQGNGEPVPVNPSGILGTDSVPPMAMAAAFATFAADGVYCEPVAITSVLTRAGVELTVPPANCAAVLEPHIAAAMNYALSQVWTGTGRPIGALPGRVSAGKTGTTSENEHTWFVGYTPELATAVWVGFPDSMTPVQRITINGQYFRNVYGSSIAGPTWKRFMTRALENMPERRFTEPSNAQINGTPVRIPSVLGRSEGGASRALRDAGFAVRVSETREFSSYPVDTVARVEPGSGTASRGATVTIFLSQGPDPAGGGGQP